jgi:hypothetical protein
VETDITAKISTWPGRSGPSTLPASTAPKKVSAGIAATGNTSPVRGRQPSPGLDSSKSTAKHATPGTATR